MNSSWLIWSSLFSLIGMAVGIYGRRRRLVVPTVVGIALMVYPYFVDSSLGLVTIGIFLLGALVAGTRWENG